MKRLSLIGALLFCAMNKEQVVDECNTILTQKIEQVNLAIQDANQSLHDDTKSSAGDKYETSREMIQQDLNRYEQQLKVLNNDAEILKRIQNQKSSHKISGLGSLIQTEKGLYFLSVSIGQIKVDNKSVFAVSLASPIGKVLVGLSVGDTFSFNGSAQTIQAIY